MASKEIDTGVVDPPRDIVESESELQEEVRRLKHQMAEIARGDIQEGKESGEIIEKYARVGKPGHDIENCWQLKMVIQELIDTNQIVVQRLDTSNINQNPLPAHAETHMIEIVHKDGDPKKSSKFVMTIRASESNLVKAPNSTKAKPLTVEGATEKLSLLNLKPPVLVVKPSKDIGASPESLKVVVPGIPNEHRRFLMKILNEAHVPDKITVNYLETTAGKIFEVNRITFSNGELPMEDRNRKNPHEQCVCVRGFDGEGKDSVGDIMLELSIGPVEFTMEFQVLDVVVSYNLLLGRPWIHDAKAVPSSLHQMVKFEWDRQEIVVHGDEDLSVCNDTIVLFIEAEDNKGPWVYQTFKTVFVEKIPEGKCIPGPKISSVSVMVANEILKNGFVSGKGLGSSLLGIVHPVHPSGNPGTFGLGFMPTEKDVKRVKILKQQVWSLPKPVTHISKSFVKPGAEKPSTSPIPKPMVDVDEELIKRFQSLFDEINMVEVGKGSSKADVQLVGPNVKLSNWEEKPKPNLTATEAINLGDQDNVRETKISVYLEPQVKEEIIKTLFEYKDVFTWSYDNMSGWSNDLVVHKLPTDPAFPLVKQKLRKFKTDMSVKIKEEIIKQLGAKVIRVTQYATWLSNVVPVPKKDGKTRVCVDYRDLNKASPKDDLPLPNIHILIDNCAKHEIRYNLKLNQVKCAFGVPSGKLLGFVVSRRGIELDPLKIKAIQELSPPKNKMEVMSLLGRLNYISRFIAQLTTTCEPIFKLLKKNVAIKWTNECQEAFDKIKRYLSNPPVLVERDEKPGWKLLFDGAANMKGVGIGVVLISETGQHYPVTAQLRFYCTNNMAEYEACILGLRLAIDMAVQKILVLGDSDLLVH
ncbi:uncharacterized protein [Nicotiana sylvestris]|uniref:uncharacterized protein n=1 Tax=Nicotiana sylvestris TaxID=4096 RepID=UPI00388C511F